MERGPHRRADAVNRAAYTPYSPIDDPVGCGLLGCLGGVIFGLSGGIILAVLATLTAALVAPIPTLAPNPTAPDLRVTLSENFLNRFAEQPTDGTIRIDVLPNNQVAVIGNTTVMNAPVQVTGLFELQFTGQMLQVRLINTQIAETSLPPELNGFFAEDVPVINQSLAAMVNAISATLGVPVIITNVSTNHVQIQLEIKESP